MIYTLESACCSNTGKVRSNNQDNFYFSGFHMEPDNNGMPQAVSFRRILKSGTSFAVFDGMGGGDFGELASYEAAKYMKSVFDNFDKPVSVNDFLVSFCLNMNQAVFNKEIEMNNFRMGSTVAGLYFQKGYAYVYNLGDSRVFCLRNREFMQLSCDHTDEKYLVQKGITNRKPRLTQHLGIDPQEMRLEPSVTKVRVKRGDKYLICSDGLTDMVTNFDIADILLTCGNVKNCTDKLIKTALINGGKDNVTVILCEIN